MREGGREGGIYGREDFMFCLTCLFTIFLLSYFVLFRPYFVLFRLISSHFVLLCYTRPALDNPYLPVSSEGGEGREYGLDEDEDDGGLELSISGGSSYKY